MEIIISSNEKSDIDIDGATRGHVLVGDIIATNKDTVIERKEINDFISSCNSPHMWEQAHDMRANYKRSVVIIVGYFPEDVAYRNKKFIPHGYKAIAALIRQGITVLMAKNDAMLSSLSLAILQESEVRDPTIPIKRVEKDGKYSVIQSMPGIGQNIGKALLENYKTIKILCDIPVEVLSEFKVNGRRIGEKKAQIIHERLN